METFGINYGEINYGNRNEWKMSNMTFFFFKEIGNTKITWYLCWIK